MNKEINFTNCKIVAGRAYNGANGKKLPVEYNGSIYMLKFPPSAKNKPTELSYSNSCISEHIASSIFNMLGVTAHETILGIYEINGKSKIVCACKDFVTENKTLYDFCSIKNTVIDSEHGGTGTDLNDILETIEKQTFVNPKELLEHFWDMFVIDAFLGNFDRHNGNWAFLYDNQTGMSTISPIYDCASCLLPQADENVMNKVLSDRSELESRVYTFPTSAVKLNGQKINYYDFLSSTDNVDCVDALNRIIPRIDIEKINTFIDNVPYISDLQKDFYKTYITARWEMIIEPVFEHINELSSNEYDITM